MQGRPLKDSASGQVEMRPRWGLTPTRLHQPAGMRTEPAPSEPRLAGTMCAATAAAEPPLEPPGVCPRLQGLRVTPKAVPSVNGYRPISGVLVLPTITAPAARRRRTTSQSSALAAKAPEQPKEVGCPARSTSSLIAI